MVEYSPNSLSSLQRRVVERIAPPSANYDVLYKRRLPARFLEENRQESHFLDSLSALDVSFSQSVIFRKILMNVER